MQLQSNFEILRSNIFIHLTQRLNYHHRIENNVEVGTRSQRGNQNNMPKAEIMFFTTKLKKWNKNQSMGSVR